MMIEDSINCFRGVPKLYGCKFMGGVLRIKTNLVHLGSLMLGVRFSLPDILFIFYNKVTLHKTLIGAQSILI